VGVGFLWRGFGGSSIFEFLQVFPCFLFWCPCCIEMCIHNPGAKN
jgi:hypothetical protein